MNCKRCNGTGDEPVQREIGRRMKAMRLEADFGLREMACRMGISHGFLSQLESGQRTWSRRLVSNFNHHLVTKHTKL